LREQSQWLGSSNLLGEALRAQVARLPERPRPQQLDTEMAQLRTQNELLNSLLRGGDTLMLELTKLKVANGQLEDALKEIN
ncbi:hypothetical protein INR18_28640, partial [Klebsiella pneumoniae]|uniref:hypothetical protein n=1 Tax=Klebsiella pneumoniae TaxID=573 RepID=UPI001E56A5C7